MSQQIRISKVVEFFPHLDPEKLEVQRMVGITNQTYRVTCLEGKIEPFILRQLVDSSDNLFLHREQESLVYQFMSDCKRGPKILAGELKYRCEQFIQSKVVPASQMLEPFYYERVAFELSRFHKLNPPSQVSRDSLFKRVFQQNKSKMLKVCKTKLDKDIYSEAEKPFVETLQKWVSESQIQKLSKILAPLEKEKCVFSHNDLLANNILVRKSDQKAVFIDYEYSMFNYPCFDLANYLNEAEFNYDHSEPPYFSLYENTPEKQAHKSRFLQCYVIAHECKNFTAYLEILEGKQERPKIEEKLSKLKQTMAIGSLLSHLVWAWWAIIMSKNPDINFDYLAFCQKRYTDYQQILKTFNM